MPMSSAYQFPRVILAIAASLAFASPLIGQRARTAPTPAGWLKRTTNSDYQINDARFTPADHAITDANLLFVEGLVSKLSGYANPRGFELLPWWHYPVPIVHDRNRLKEYSLAFTVFVPTRKANPDGNGGFGFEFNPSFTAIADVAVADEENGGRLYLERERGTPVHGATLTYSAFDVENVETFRVVFTSGDQMPFLPVTREEFLRAQIFTLEGKNQENIKKARAATAKSPYETWLEGAAERKKNRETTIAMLRLDKDAADKMRAQMEKQERDMTEAYKKDEPNFRAMAADAQKVANPGDAPRAKLAAMSSVERSLPAWLFGAELVPAGTPHARAVIRENPAFFRARGSPVNPRAIMVILANLPEVAMQAQRQLYRELDWAALKSRLDPRP
jgi:hypothetical protein